ncbi:glycosyl transferase family 8 protein [Rutstroemia sp. NJR-2017a BBW]|nr:glycosyl transferase family 8 protein [Rutstroemia sp. NJR-2017a BBW]
MASEQEDVYATLLLEDSYLPGAMVLAHSLKDAGTTKKLAILVTTDTVSAETRTELETIFDHIIPVERVRNEATENLHLMGRPDLHSTFTKITLWKQTQFRRIVYMDADMVALRAPDELFDLPQDFSASPDIGWPDIFNTGLMVLKPNMGDYYALLAMAQRGISFDGADQGLLNMHFKNTFNRLSFTYNVTPSAHYQYLPAFKHFKNSISAAHFIGQNKPWKMGRLGNGGTPYDEMIGKWWSVYDKHYKSSSNDGSSPSQYVQYWVKGEFQPNGNQAPSETFQATVTTEDPFPETDPASQSLHETERPFHETNDDIPKETEEIGVPSVLTDLDQEYTPWDASKAPPPQGSGPEASNFPGTHYDMSHDATPFKAPGRYPDPPSNMYYEVPKTPKYQRPAPIFPWEQNAPEPTRVFAEDNYDEAVPETPTSAAPTNDDDYPVTPSTPTNHGTDADPWQTYSRGNAWDEDPDIERYVGNMTKGRKGNVQVVQGTGAGIEQSPGRRRASMRLTDFPTELERPSLPVTPAPIRRPSFWGEERNAEGQLPGAEGVPSQEDWDPAAQLDMLARRQSDVLANKLEIAREMPTRSLPFGSENVRSPTYVAQGPTGGNAGAGTTQRTTIEEPAYHGPGAAWEKGEDIPTRGTPLPPSEEEKDVLTT